MADNTDPNAAPPPLSLASTDTTAGAVPPLAGFGLLQQNGAGTPQALVNTHVNDGSGGVQQASFSVDVEQIPGLVAKYRGAQDKLRGIKRKAAELRELPGPAADEVSQKLAQSLGSMAGEEPGKLTWVVDATIDRLQNQIEQLEAAQRDYQSTDEEAIPRKL
ncbi:hypothetical protein [Bounagaea algeriensis]